MRALENKNSFYFFDSETSLYYLSQRYYDPETYSFLLSKDPEKADGEESTGEEKKLLECQRDTYPVSAIFLKLKTQAS